MALSVDIKKRLGNFQLAVSFDMEDEIIALFGSSGCGKSVTLRCIAGIMTPDEGRIVLDGRTLFDSEKRISLAPQDRRVGCLFQHYALFPNMTVEENISAVIRDRRQRRARTDTLLKRFHLENVRTQRSSQLSGGQQQRTALARILASEPQTLLLDEPFSALDSYLKSQLEQELWDTLAGFGGAVVWVSHDRDEVFRNCRSVCVLDAGSSMPVVSPHELFVNPRTASAAKLSGCKNILSVIPGETSVFVKEWGISLECGQKVSRDITAAGLRAHHLYFASEDAENAIPCRVVRSMDNVFSTIVLLRPEGSLPDAPALRLEVSKEKMPELYERMAAAIDPQNILLLK